MKALVVSLVLLFVLASSMEAQYPTYTIRQIQEVPLDSLRVLDTLQRTALGIARWTAQRSPRYRDTVTVVGVVVAPAKVINFTSIGYNFLIADTGSRSVWGGLFVRPAISSTTNPGDTILAIQWGMLNVNRGNLIRMTGVIDEFPVNDNVSLTQIVPLYSQPLQVLGNAPIPPHQQKLVTDFQWGLGLVGPIRFSTGEPMEAMRVELTNLLVHSVLNNTNGTFNMVDANGNMISMMDASKWFTTRGHRDPASDYVLPPIGARIDTIRGYIMTNSGAEAPRGYRIAPLMPGDIVPGISQPRMTVALRSPSVVTPDSGVRVSVRAFKILGGYDISSVKLYYSLNNAAFTELNMTYTTSDSTARAIIPVQPANTFVRYFYKAIDTQNNSTLLASYSSSAANDTSYGTFFYTVLNRPLTIRDIQYTPFLNGYSSYAENYPFGGIVTVSGIISADTSQIRFVTRPGSIGGTSAYYLQSGNDQWSGIWVVGPESTMIGLRLGDSVTVTGQVQEWQSFQQNVTTRIANVRHPVILRTRPNPIPAPVVLTTGRFGPGAANGDRNAEPYESMLVRFNNVEVTNIWPYFADPTQYEIDDGSGGVWVHRDGTNTYTNQPGDSVDGTWRVLRVGNRLTHMIGVIHFSVNRYKFVPRSNADFGTLVGVEDFKSNFIPKSFALGQNYPNPFNPSTRIEFDLPASTFVTLKVYNLLGQEVATLVNGEKVVGRHYAEFDARALSTGVYFYRLATDQFVSTKKMLLIK